MIEFNAQQIAQWIDGEIEGNSNTVISKVAKIEEADEQSLAFLANLKYESFLYESNAGIVLIPKDLVLKRPTNATIIRVEDPYRAFAGILQQYEKIVRPTPKKGIHPTAYIDASVKIPEDAYIGAFVVIEKGVQLGSGVKLYSHVTIGANTIIGDQTKLYSHVNIYDGCKIGNQVIIHSGTVIGSDGFGFAPNDDGSFMKVAQLGGVEIGHHVEIGANTTIDRATMGFTKIGDHCKIDNLVQIAHNVVIGKGTVIAAQTGISGSTQIGNHCMIGGQVGVVGHIKIADGTKINAQSGVSKSVLKTNTAINGTPAGDYQATLRSQVMFRRLPEMMKRIEALEEKNK